MQTTTFVPGMALNVGHGGLFLSSVGELVTKPGVGDPFALEQFDDRRRNSHRSPSLRSRPATRITHE